MKKNILKQFATISFILGLLLLASCGKETPVKETNPSAMDSLLLVDDLYDADYYKELSDYEALFAHELPKDGSTESEFVYKAVNDYVNDLYETANQNSNTGSYIMNRDYIIFGVDDIDIGAAGQNGGVKIYRIRYGLKARNDEDLKTSDCMEVYDGSYYRYEALPFMVARYENSDAAETEWSILRFINKDEIKKQYTTKAMLELYTSPYRAAAMDLLRQDDEIRNIIFEGPDYRDIFGTEEVLAVVKDRLSGFYKDEEAVTYIDYDDYCGYDESSFISYYVQLKNGTDCYFIVTADRESNYDIVISEIPKDLYHSCDYQVVSYLFNLLDPEVSIRIDPYGFPYGPGSSDTFYGFPVKEEPIIEKQDWDPIYSEGSYWYTVTYDGFEAICYYSGEDGSRTVNSIYTTRTDLCTYRGIRVGATKEEVYTLYPEIQDVRVEIAADEEADYLWFNPWRNDPELCYGPNLLLYFENDCVSSIFIINYFN